MINFYIKDKKTKINIELENESELKKMLISFDCFQKNIKKKINLIKKIEINSEKFDGEIFKIASLVPVFSYKSENLKIERSEAGFIIECKGTEFCVKNDDEGTFSDDMFTNFSFFDEYDLENAKKISTLLKYIELSTFNFKSSIKDIGNGWIKIKNQSKVKKDDKGNYISETVYINECALIVATKNSEEIVNSISFDELGTDKIINPRLPFGKMKVDGLELGLFSNEGSISVLFEKENVKEIIAEFKCEFNEKEEEWTFFFNGEGEFVKSEINFKVAEPDEDMLFKGMWTAYELCFRASEYYVENKSLQKACKNIYAKIKKLKN